MSFIRPRYSKQFCLVLPGIFSVVDVVVISCTTQTSQKQKEFYPFFCKTLKMMLKLKQNRTFRNHLVFLRESLLKCHIFSRSPWKPTGWPPPFFFGPKTAVPFRNWLTMFCRSARVQKFWEFDGRNDAPT